MSMTEDKAEVEAAWEHVGVLREVVGADEYAWWYVIFGGPPQGSQLTATEAAAWAAAAAFTREHVEKVRRARFDCLHVAVRAVWKSCNCWTTSGPRWRTALASISMRYRLLSASSHVNRPTWRRF